MIALPRNADDVSNGWRSKLAAVLFDFDLTLADSSAGAIECTNFALNALGLPEAAPLAIRPTIGLPLHEALQMLTGVSNPESSARFARLFLARADEVVVAMTNLYPGVPELQLSLRRASLRTAIVSTKFRYRIEAILARAGIADAVDTIIGGEDVTNHKPAPDGILLLLERWHVARARAIYVGDHLVDGLAAKAAGVRFIAVLSGSTTRHAFAELGVSHALDSVIQLCEYLELA